MGGQIQGFTNALDHRAQCFSSVFLLLAPILLIGSHNEVSAH